jgi:myo-inositol-1(or 4)-monophosphatase
VSAPTTTALERERLARLALSIADEAAALVAKAHRSRPRADEKGRADLVTEFDRASEALIVARLAALTPNVAIVAEEGGEAAGAGGLVWYVDPIDGTTNFVHGHPFWCVSIGLAEGGVPVAGAVVAPAIGARWLGWIGGEGGSKALRNGEPCAVSDTSRLGEAMIATGFPPSRDRAPANNFASFEAVKRAARAVRRCGSAAMDLCFVADGTYDGYWERALHVWDAMAAAAVVLAAGGTITSLDGGAPRYAAGHLVASNGRVHDELLAAIARG